MARGVKQTDEQKLESIENQILEMEDRKAKIQATISNLKAQKKEILDSIEQKKLSEIAQLLEASGKTADDVLAILKAE